MEIFYALGYVVLGGVISWYITQRYYFKNLNDSRDNQKILEDKIEKLSEELELKKMQEKENAQEIINSNEKIYRDAKKEERLKDCLECYKINGSPVKLIDTYDDLTSEEKADLYDKVCMIKKRRPGKNNPYRN